MVILASTLKNKLVFGIDEAGRGPIAGPVVAACVTTHFSDFKILKKIGVKDSKQLTHEQRKIILASLPASVKFGVGIVCEKTIDSINILQATKRAMHHAFLDLEAKISTSADLILVDGNVVPFENEKIITIIKGDQKNILIALASIIAKETRDLIMRDLHEKHPHFEWNQNKGYPTESHLQKLKQHGICEFHRKTFHPVKIYCER